jgi:ABC-type sugar transport system permease subunit
VGARRRPRSRRSANLQALLWVAPAVLTMAFVFGYGVYRVVREALHREGAWVGLDNLRIVINDPPFRTAVGHNVRLLLTLPIIIGLALLISILLHERMRGWRMHRFVVFLPYILPVPVVGVLFGQILTLHGMLNSVLGDVGLSRLQHDWLGNPDIALYSLAGVIVWKELGFGVILFLARLLALPEDLFEAARVDGAGFWRTHWHITLPLMRSIIGFYFVIESITLFSWVFSYVYVMTRGGPGDSTQVAETYIYDNAFTSNIPWLAASAATVLLIGFAALAAVFLVGRWVIVSRRPA